jgi:hypothetical protein
MQSAVTDSRKGALSFAFKVELVVEVELARDHYRAQLRSFFIRECHFLFFSKGADGVQKMRAAVHYTLQS